MNDIFDALKKMAEDGRGRGVLAEITGASGSTPRGVGARMFLGPDGAFSGTVGGGSVERHAQGQARQVYDTGVPVRRTYSLGGGNGQPIEAVCGGSVTVDFTPVDPTQAAALLARLDRPPAVFIYGAGHVGKALADALHLLGMPVTVTDGREGLLTPERFPHARRRLCPLETAPMDAGPEDFIVIMTHGHEHDFILAHRAMGTQAGYIGLLASHKKADMARRQLLEAGFAQEDIDRRLRCPIGLAIGAETPEEIAVSVAGEMIAFLRLYQAP